MVVDFPHVVTSCTMTGFTVQAYTADKCEEDLNKLPGDVRLLCLLESTCVTAFLHF